LRDSELVGTHLHVAEDRAIAGAAVEQADSDVGGAEDTRRYATELLSVGQRVAQRISALQQRGVELVVEAGADGEIAGKRDQRDGASHAHRSQQGDSGPQRHPPVPEFRVGCLRHGGVSRNA
jgi:hypothetical protein